MTATPVELPFPLHLTACGAVTAVGGASASTFAAFRAGVSAFKITSYRTSYGEPITGAPIDGVTASTLGLGYLKALALPALKECLEGSAPTPPARTALILSVGESLPREEARNLLGDLAAAQGLEGDDARLALIPGADISIIPGLAQASRLIASGKADRCIVGGVGTNLTKETLRKMERDRQLKTSRNTDGVIPGEAACFVAVGRAGHPPGKTPGLVVRGLGYAEPEGSTPRRGEILARAIRDALSRSGVEARTVGFRPSNQAGQSVPSLESGIASMRIFRDPGPYPPTWLPAVSIGAVGPAMGALLMGWTAAGFQKRYAPGQVALFELVSPGGPQGAMIATAA